MIHAVPFVIGVASRRYTRFVRSVANMSKWIMLPPAPTSLFVPSSPQFVYDPDTALVPVVTLT